MKRWLWVLALLAVVVGAIAQQAIRGQAPGQRPPQNPGDLGPDAQGSTLRFPGMDAPGMPAPAPGPAMPAALQNLYNPALVANPYAGVVRTGGHHYALPPSNQVDLNRDITITPEVGPWTILVMSYTTPRQPAAPGLDAAKMARDFVTEWNSNAAYARFKLKAHVFNFGAAEKQKEYERVQKLKQEQIDELNKLKLDGKAMPIRIQTLRIDEHTAVLLGGFRDAKAAMDVAQEIRKLKPDPDLAKRVELDCIYSGALGAERPGAGNPSAAFAVSQFVNPFAKAMPVRNPAVPATEQAGMSAAEELGYLRKVNSKEPLSLLNTKKPFTLAVKQFNAQFKATTDAKDAENFFNHVIGLSGKKNGDWKDFAYQNAHTLADGLRKAGLEAYVLHCQSCSYVTIGSYDTPQDPKLVQMQRYLSEVYFKQENFRVLDLYERPIPMAVPGVSMGAMPGIAAR